MNESKKCRLIGNGVIILVCLIVAGFFGLPFTSSTLRYDGYLDLVILYWFPNARINRCDNILRQIESAKDQYAIEHGLKDGDIVVSANLESYFRLGWEKGAMCPCGGKYTINPIGIEPRCSVHSSRSDIEKSDFEREIEKRATKRQH